ncbi:MAG: adenine phosphoribosyltransferase [Pseudomonadota bacterium]
MAYRDGLETNPQCLEFETLTAQHFIGTDGVTPDFLSSCTGERQFRNGDVVLDRWSFRKRFGSGGPVVLPVIHVLTFEKTEKNMRVAFGEGAPGVFLINHDFDVETFLPIIEHARKTLIDAWIGVNFLAVTGEYAFPKLGALSAEGIEINAYWADDARIDERVESQTEAETISRVREKSGWPGLYFGGTAFKKQRHVDPGDYGRSATIAARYMDIVTTSGPATGKAADATKITTFRDALGDHPLALASGVTPENAETYHEVDAFLVATGINFEGDFYSIEAKRLAKLMRVCERMSGG